MTMSRKLPAALLLLACASCASAPEPAGEGAGARPGAEARPARRAANRITRAEIEESSHRDAYALIEAVRPRWLRGQAGSERVGRVVVEVGSVVAGGVEMLREISLDTVESLEFNDSFDVTQSGASTSQYAGTIRVVLRTRR
jgi:hypothetical protein